MTGTGNSNFSYLQFTLYGIVFSTIIAVLTYYGAVAPIFKNRLVAAMVGLVLGFSAAAGLLASLSEGPEDKE